jgi:hypothetical protein
LQECLGSSFSEATITPATVEELAVACDWPELGWALRRAVVPPRRPAKAAARARLLTVVVFMKSSFLRLVQAVCLEVEFDPL